MDVAPIPGRVTGREFRKNRDGDHVVLMEQVVVTGATDVRTVELMNPPGEKSNPANGTMLVIIPLGKTWRVAVAADDLVDPSDLGIGEKMLYSTDSDGAVVTKILLKNDGTLEITGDTALSIVVPEVNMTADLNVTGTITATVDVVAAGISGASHVHEEHDGPSTLPPT